jgi:diaminopimelate decarboxylase
MKTHQEVQAMVREHGSPFYLFDREAFSGNFLDFQGAFRRRYPQVIVSYSYKTNYIPYVCALAKSLGAYAEVVSRLELDLALRLGYRPEQIIFNGPLKKDEDIAFALGSGSIVNLDNLREVEQACKCVCSHDRPLMAGLRVNIALVDEAGRSDIQEGRETGRFGFAPEALPAAVAQLQGAGIRVHSLHGHTSSSSRAPWVYRKIANTLAEAAEAYCPETIEYLNVGGGMYGRPVPAMGLSDIPDYDDYAEAICGELQKRRWFRERRPWLVLEPGMALVADTLSFITQVFEIKHLGGHRLAVVDGSIFNIKPTMHRKNHPFSIIADGIRTGCAPYHVAGATCMEKDLLLSDIEAAEIRRDDFIRIDNVGAYTLVMTPPFILPAPPVLVREGSSYRRIRQRQSFDDFFGTFTFAG